MTHKPRLFIASSSEGLTYAEAIFSQLERVSEPSLWTHDMSSPSETLVESLERVIANTDYAVVVLSPDDVRQMRGSTSSIPRDNVIFEMGLLIGKLGRNKVFMVVPEVPQWPATLEGIDLRLPSDISGMLLLGYVKRTDGNTLASVATACRRISSTLASQSEKRARPHIPRWLFGTTCRSDIYRAWIFVVWLRQLSHRYSSLEYRSDTWYTCAQINCAKRWLRR